MLRTLHRILPAGPGRRLASLVAWLVAAAALHGGVLGLVGIAVAMLLDTGEGAAPWLVTVGIGTVAFVAVQWAAQMIAFRTGSETARALHLRLGGHVARLPLGWFTPTRQAELIDSATGGVPRLMSYPAILLRPAITAVVTPVAAAAVLAVLDWRYGLAVLVATVIVWYASRLSHHLARRVDTRRHQVSVEAANRILEHATLQPMIRTDQRPDDDGALADAIAAAARESRRSTATVLPGLLLFGFTLNVLFACLIGLGVLWVADVGLTVPAFVGLLVVTTRLTAIAAGGAELAAALRLQHGALTRIRNLLDAPPLPVLDAVLPPMPGLAGGGGDVVIADGVTFAYDETPVLDGIDFTLPRRGLTALVGPSGSGKTTLARLLARFWDPNGGHVCFDGVDLRALDSEEFYARIAMVFQDDHLLDTTIGDNIRIGRPDATDDEIREAATAAALDTTIAELPAGLDTPVGPGGSRLSGGQRQRVSIARALLKAAPLTLMDEATSALDPENTRLVGLAARRLARIGSVVVIAHDLDTIRHADQILVLDDGHIVQRGTHADLAGRPGRYRALLDAQHVVPSPTRARTTG